MRAKWITDSLLSLALFFAVASLSFFPAVQGANRRLSDSYFRIQPVERNSSVVVVAIDDASLQKYGRWPWSRSTLARLVRAIAAQNPQVIGIDILLSERQSEAADGDLRDALQSSGNVVLVDKIGSFPDGPRWLEPLPEFARAAVAVGHAEAVLDADGICRRFPPEELSIAGPRYAFGIEVARKVARRPSASFLAHYGVHYTASGESVVLAKPLLIPIAFQRNPIETISAARLLAGEKLDELRDKVVLVGFGGVEIGDRITTPVSRGLPTPGVEIHAEIVDGILAGRALNPLSLRTWALIVALACFALVQIFRRWRGWKTIPLFLGFAVLIYVGGLAALRFAHSFLPTGSLLLAGMLAPLLIYGVELTAVEKSVTRQMRLLQQFLAYRQQADDQIGSDLSWRLKLLMDLQEELGLRFELFRSLLEATRDLVVVFDAEGRLLFANQAFSDAWRGFLPDSLSEARAKIAESKDAPIIQAGTITEGEASLDGKLYSVRIVPLPISSVMPKGGSLLSMTNLHMRVERDRAREEALGFVTHELRTPLVAIQGFAELMSRYPNAPASAHAPETILRESRRLLALINSYLDVLRTDAGARPLRSNPVAVSRMILQVFDLLSPLAEASSIRLSLECDEHISVRGDEPLLTGAVLNLVSNAIKYGERGSAVQVVAELHGEELELQVHNSGEPITPNEVSQVFDRFVRGRKHEDFNPGWGLGLSFVKRIVERHGGSISVESTAERGTTFTLRLRGAKTMIGAASS